MSDNYLFILKSKQHCSDNKVHPLYIAKLLVVNWDGSQNPVQLLESFVSFLKMAQVGECSVKILLNIGIVVTLLFGNDLCEQTFVLLPIVNKPRPVVPVLSSIMCRKALQIFTQICLTLMTSDLNWEFKMHLTSLVFASFFEVWAILMRVSTLRNLIKWNRILMVWALSLFLNLSCELPYIVFGWL